MKTPKVLLCLSLLAFHTSLFAQTWMWGQAGYGSEKSNDYGSPVASDKDGNVYLAGQFQTTIIFGSTILSGNTENAYLVKYNLKGEVQWASAANNNYSGDSYCTSVATDGDGNVFITGEFYGTVSFGIITLTSSSIYTNENNTFLVKYDENGNVLWAKQSMGSYYYAYNGIIAYSVATDKSGNSFITGYFEDTVSFGSSTLISFNTPAIFVVKYDPSGNVLWATQSTNYYSNNEGYSSIATDNSGNSYITGTFTEEITFGSTTLYTYGNSAVYIVKYSPSGSVLWAKQSENASISGSATSTTVVTDQANNAYITGEFDDSIKFGSFTLGSSNLYTNLYSAFLAKYDATGNVVWAKQSSPGWVGTALASDESNNIYLAGSNDEVIYNDSLTFGNFKLSNAYSEFMSYLVEFNSEGFAACGSLLDNLGYDGQRIGVASDPTGFYIYTGGTFSTGPIITSTDTLIEQGGGANVFVGRWKPCFWTEPPSESAGAEPCGSFFIPDAFSPNKDGYNDILYVRSSCINSMDFAVFDRWGNKVFESENMSDGWDGTYKGSPVTTGTYIWYLKASLFDGTTVEKSGNVALVR